MIDLHERLSEYSYGYAVTREVEALLKSVGLSATPFFPSLPHEKELGFDVGFKDQGRVVVLQFKLGAELNRFRRTYSTQTIPTLARPFWRFGLDTAGHQFIRLREFELEGAETYYVAPRFSDWILFDQAYQAGTILDSSLLLPPSQIEQRLIAQGETPGYHRVVYDGTRRYVCSEPGLLEEVSPSKFADRVLNHIRESKLTLGQSLQRLFNRVTDDRLVKVTPSQRADIFSRAKSDEDAMAEIVGLEALTIGAQLLFVTSVQ